MMKKLCFVLCILLPLALRAQEKRLALVIGNSAYEHGGVLKNPVSDAYAMNKALTDLGFDVLVYYNLDEGEMKEAIDDFGLKLRLYDVGLFFYAGHGIQSGGKNYFVPVEANLLTEKQVEYDCVEASRVLSYMDDSKADVNIMILDACRNNPFERSWSRSTQGKGLAFMNAPAGTLIAYATAPGSTASDGSGANGLYTSAILKNLKTPGITILQLFQNVRSEVAEESYYEQTPWESTSLIGDFYFVQGSEHMKPQPVTDKQAQAALIVPTQQAVDHELTRESEVAREDGPTREDEAVKEIEDPVETKASDHAEDFFVVDIDGNSYRTVQIGQQVWMAENLRVTRYADGEIIPQVLGKGQWNSLKIDEKAYCWDEDAESGSGDIGYYYNWAAAVNGISESTSNSGGVQGVCPDGWHLPGDEEWKQLEMYLGMPATDADATEWRGYTEGNKLKATGTELWTNDIGASNETGFNALPGGYRLAGGKFVNYGRYACYWSATAHGDREAWDRFLSNSHGKIERSEYRRKSGFSVRCVKD